MWRNVIYEVAPLFCGVIWKWVAGGALCNVSGSTVRGMFVAWFGSVLPVAPLCDVVGGTVRGISFVPTCD